MRVLKKVYIYRGIFYIVGLFILAVGLTLNTKAGLGVSPILSVPYSISEIWQLNFGNMTFLVYGIFVLIQILLHFSQKQFAKERRKLLISDVLQFPLCYVFTRFLNIFSVCIPDFKTVYADVMPVRAAVLVAAIICTGIGAAMSLDMRLVPNPGDGIVQCLSETIHRDVGLAKNLFDCVNLCITFSIGLLSGHLLVGIGVGTAVAVIGVGRVIAGFNWLFLEKMNRLSGLSATSRSGSADKK